jgi:2',3'-cyclic-nucleotide 2'-phosphodiesterase (5'-nucleotidase family)
MKHSYLAITLLAAALCSCTPKEQTLHIVAGNIKVTAIDSNDGASEVRAILERDKAYIDSIKRPVLGETTVALEKYIPESPLMNFAADALMEMAQLHSKQKIDIAITNKGGLRSNIAAGTITFGDIYNVFTFENRLAYLTLTGEQLTQLCKEIAKVGGEAISGMRLVITPNGELVGATVGGKAIKPQATYRIATLDYLSQGNDNLTTLAQGTDLEITKHLLRDLMVEYVNRQTAKGKKISAACDGRITIKE